MEFCFYCENVDLLPTSLREECSKKGVAIHPIPEPEHVHRNESVAEQKAIGLLAGTKQMLSTSMLTYYEKGKIPVLVAGKKSGVVPVPINIETIILFAPEAAGQNDRILEIANQLHFLRNTFGPGEWSLKDMGIRQ